MSGIKIHLDQLRNMIGIKLHYQGIPCQVVEVLEDGPSLVLVSTLFLVNLFTNLVDLPKVNSGNVPALDGESRRNNNQI